MTLFVVGSDKGGRFAEIDTKQAALIKWLQAAGVFAPESVIEIVTPDKLF